MTMPDLVATRDVNALNDWLAEADPLEIAEELGRLPVADRAIPFRLLSKDRALEVFEALDPLHQQELLEGLRDTSVRELVEGMDPDDRARLVDEMPAKVAKQVLAGLSPRERALTATLLGYAESSAGRVMSPEVANLKANQTAAEALSRLRRIGSSAETIYALPVTDDQRRLVGALGLRDLVLADPDTLVGDLMDKDVYSARVDQDQEEVARLIQEADLLALPILDTEGRLVGIGTGGNAGSQSATTVTRALAVGALRTTDVVLVVLREGRVGVLLGGMLAALAFVPTLLFIDAKMAAVVSLTLLSVCTLATLDGSLLPLLVRRLGFDPAVMSAPFISTLVDATGLIVYFLIAKLILGLA